MSIIKEVFFYAFLGAVGQAGGLILAKFAFEENNLNAVFASLVRIIFSILILTPLLYFTGRFRNPVQTFRNDYRAFIYTAIGAFIGPFLGITFSMTAIANVKIGAASTIMATVPVLMLPMAKYLNKEKLSSVSIIGAFLAVIGVAILFLI